MKFSRNKSYKPVKPEGPEGEGSEWRIAFSNADRAWEERLDLIEILENALQENRLSCNRRDGWLVVSDDLYLRPEFVMVTPLEPSGVRTTTTISVAHEKYVPHGLFEYQHSTGDDTNEITNSFETFRQLYEGEGFYGIHLLALRDQEGKVNADCRVNGIDWEPGKESLIKYAETWADRGVEMRKQYVVIYTPDATGAERAEVRA